MKEKFKNTILKGSIKIRTTQGQYWEESKKVIVNHMIQICEDYNRKGDTLSLRQLYYQLVARDYIPNHGKVYKKIGSIKDDLVYSGLIDWDIFEDRGRVPHQAYFEDDIPGALRRTINSYRLDRQMDQPNHIEVWTEKDAISGVLKRVTTPHTIRLVVNKGYTSSTAIYEAYVRFMESMLAGKKIKILYFGDHDPSGLDMIRDIQDRLTLMFNQGDRKLEEEFESVIESWTTVKNVDGEDEITDRCWAYSKEEDCQSVYPDGDPYFDTTKAFFKEHFEIIPIGLTMKQIKEFKPPHNPAKITDPRAKWYIKQYGQVSWEVDALSPDIMRHIVGEAILEHLDAGISEIILKREQEDKSKLINLIGKL